MKPDDGYITDSLGWVYFKRGDYRKAVTTLDRAVRLVSDDPVILEHAGDAHQKLGQSVQALEYYRRAIDAKKDDREALSEKIKALGGDVP